MALFSNIFRKVTSTFAYEGKSWGDTWDYIKDLPWKTSPISAYRSYKESRVFYRAKPFLEGLDERLKPPDFSITPTKSHLKDKYHYIFDVSFKYTHLAQGPTHTMSLLSSTRITKQAALDRMYIDLLEHKKRKEYLNLDDIEIKLVGVRESQWV